LFNQTPQDCFIPITIASAAGSANASLRIPDVNSLLPTR
jgi:hypothetical protein